MSNLGNSAKNEAKGTLLTRKLSSKDNESSPNPDKKFNSTNAKSYTPKSESQIKNANPYNRSQSNPESKPRYAKRKPTTGNSARTPAKRNEIPGGQRGRHSISRSSDSKRDDPLDDLIKSGSPASSCDSCPSSPASSPKLDVNLDPSDEPSLPQLKPDQVMKPPFTNSMAKSDESIELPLPNHEGKCSRQCSHSHLLAIKNRAPNKQTGQLRNMKNLSSKRMDTLNGYLGIYEERLRRVNTDHSFLMKDAQLKCDDMICQITAHWEALKGRIEQDYVSLIQDAESHRNNIAQELCSHENLQEDSSTLYDICDLEEDDQDLTSWVDNLKKRYNDVLSNYQNRDAMDFISEFSINSIEGMRENIEAQISQLFKSTPKLSIDSSLTSGIARKLNTANSLNTDNDHTENPNSNIGILQNTDYPRNFNTDNPRFLKPQKLGISNVVV